jgi:hypothetical protein
MARVRGFIKENMTEIFRVLTYVIDKNKLDSAGIFSVDEKALSAVRKHQKILALRGKQSRSERK